eukprot:TRINITY_DN6895_c0_g1_i12.p2 TRINITY_DN6895_c0_g1~~TRINITY_DN6895_c0_g1_i12.p2  ORF type:complete len:182 (-),score=57.36 TRINITY_DN6895_c0_g1_i12:1163-1708(-)
MGAGLERLLQLFGGKQEARLVMLGLDGAGKTTILYRLKIGELVCSIPTVGFNVETMERRGVSFTVWDVGGQDTIRPLWRHYFRGTQGLIFVLDSNDRERVGEAADELQRLLCEPELRGAALLVFANKQDLPFALSAAQLTDRLGLEKLCDRKWYLQVACAASGDGVYEGLDWLASAVTSKQ